MRNGNKLVKIYSPKIYHNMINPIIYINYGLMVILFFPIIKAIVLQWYEYEEDSHGFFIVPITIYLIWQKRGELKKIPYSSNSLGLIAFIFAIAGYLTFIVGDIAFLARVSMLFVFYSSIVIFYGYEKFKAILFPLIYLIFMIPVPKTLLLQLSLPLRLLVSKISVALIQFTDIPIYREGNIILLSSGVLEVAPACSGLRSLVSLLALSALIAYFFQEKTWNRILCFLAAIPIAIFTNIIRVFSSIIIFQYISTSIAEGMLHESWGLIIFCLSMVFLILINIGVKRIF